MNTSAGTNYSEERALAMPIANVAAQLVDLLGYRVVGVIADVTQARTVRQWAEGGTRPPELTDDKLRLALQAALILRERFSPDATRAFFSGTNPRLDDRSPAMVIREDYEDPTARRRVIGAARAFLTTAG